MWDLQPQAANPTSTEGEGAAQGVVGVFHFFVRQDTRSTVYADSSGCSSFFARQDTRSAVYADSSGRACLDHAPPTRKNINRTRE